MRKRRYGEAMFIGVSVGTGLLCYFINIMCQYDLETDQTAGRIRYFLRMDRKRCVFLIVDLVVCMGMTGLFVMYRYGPLKMIRYLLLLALLYPIAAEDARNKVIPNRWLLYMVFCRACLFVLEAVYLPALILENMKFTLFGGMMCGGVFLIAYILSRRAIGMGDVKLAAVMGTCLGFQTTFLAMFAASLLSAVYGGSMVLRKKKGLRDEIAFGPFIALGTWIVLLIGA